MAANAIHVTILSDKNAKDSDIEEIDGVLINRIKRLMWMPIASRNKLVGTILKSEPDLVVWYGTPFSATYLSRLKSIGKPLIWDIERGLPNLEILSRISFQELLNRHHRFLWQELLAALIPRFVIRMVANSSFISRIVVSNRSLKGSLCKIGVDPGKIAVIPSTIEKEASSRLEIHENPQESKREAGFQTDDLLVMYFGSPCTLRGVDTAIIGMQKILTKRRQTKLLIFSRRNLTESTLGDECLRKEEEKLKRLVKNLGLDEHVEIISGILDRLELEKYLCASDIVVLPFKHILSEPPLSVLEVMNMGKAVVTTNIGSLAEIVSNNRGILIKPNSAESLAQAVLFLADHPNEAVRVGKNAQGFAASLPDWEYIALQFEELLRNTQAVSE